MSENNINKIFGIFDKVDRQAKEEIVNSFIEVKERAELKALSSLSLNRQLSEKEFVRFRELFDRYNKQEETK